MGKCSPRKAACGTHVETGVFMQGSNGLARAEHNCRLCSRWKAPGKTLQLFPGLSLGRDNTTDPCLDDSCAQLIG